MTTRTKRTNLTVTGLLGLGFLASGCMTVRNERLVVGPEGAPTTVHPAALWATEPITQATGPSVTSASRDHWTEVTIVSVNDGVEHQEPFTRVPAWPTIDQATARSRGEFPTPDSSVETGGSAGAQVLEGFAWPVAIGADIVMAIPRMFDQANRSPIGRYERDVSATPAPTPAPAPAPN